MFRKRKSVSPHYRIPAPFNPVAGSDASLYGPMRLMARFVLDEALTTSDESALATLTTTHQWGPGVYHCPDITIHVHNLLTETADVYKFYGAAGNAGICFWNYDNHWQIVGLNDGGLIGACLAENHPGRAATFDIYLGEWSPTLHQWIYDIETTYTAIDWRYGVPYPALGSTGLFEARPSDTLGVIYEVVSLDCESPGTCAEE